MTSTRPARRFLFVLALISLPLQAVPRPADGAGFFLTLYSTLCVQAGGQPEIVATAMAKAGVPPLSAAESKFFLLGRPGQVWPVSDASGVYRVALQEDGSCAIFAQRADAAVLDRGFADLLRQIPAKPPFRMVRTADERKQSEGITTHYLSFLFGIPGEKGAFQFALTTSPSVTSAVQALATFRRVAEGVPAPPKK